MLILPGGRSWSWTATGTVCLVLLVTLLNCVRQSYPDSSGKGSIRAYVPQAVVVLRETKLATPERADGLVEEEVAEIESSENGTAGVGGVLVDPQQEEDVGEEEEDVGEVVTWQSLQDNIRPTQWWVDTLTEFSARAAAYPEVLSAIPKDSQHYMVMVEPRRYDLLPHVLRNFVFYLAPKGWGLVMVHGPDNARFVKHITRGWSHVHLLEMEMLGSSVGRTEYSRLLVSASFWSSLPGSVHLFFQTDCFLRDDGIERWLQYDYAGAPWANWVEHRLRGRVGNGGFSLRRKDAMIRCIEAVAWDQSSNEDIYFSLDCAHLLNIPGEQEAMEFVVETLWDDKRPPLGFHHAWQYLEYDRSDLSKNQLHHVMRHYNVQPFLARGHKTATVTADETATVA